MEPVNLQAEWGAVTSAPFLSLGVLLLVLFGVWMVLHFLYRHRIERLQGDLESEQAESNRLRGRVAEYEAKAGRTPDEAHARIEALEERLKRLAPRQLTEEQINRLAGVLQTGMVPRRADIMVAPGAPDGTIFQDGLVQAFGRANWQITYAMLTIATPQSLSRTGLTIQIIDPARPDAQTKAFTDELREMGIESELTQGAAFGLKVIISSRLP